MPKSFTSKNLPNCNNDWGLRLRLEELFVCLHPKFPNMCIYLKQDHWAKIWLVWYFLSLKFVPNWWQYFLNLLKQLIWNCWMHSFFIPVKPFFWLLYLCCFQKDWEISILYKFRFQLLWRVSVDILRELIRWDQECMFFLFIWVVSIFCRLKLRFLQRQVKKS